MITVYKEMDFSDIKEMAWCCDEEFRVIENNDLEDEFIELVESYFPDGVDKTELNDFIRFNVWNLMNLDLYNREGKDEDEIY